MAESQLHKGLEQFELSDGVINTKKELQRNSNATVMELMFHGLKCVGIKIKEDFYCKASSREKTNIQKRLEQECKVLAELRHPNIIQFMGVMYDEHILPMMVTEFLPVTLNVYLWEHGVLPDPISYSILDDVAKGLCYLHAHQPIPIIHKSLTATNILLTESKGAKISCLGEAKIQCFKLPIHDTAQQSDTQQYCDIFSFGVLINHVVSGNCPVLPSTSDHAFMLHQMDKGHPLMGLSKQCLTADENTSLKATDILESIREIRVKNKIDSCTVVQESVYAAEWQQLLSTFHKLQSDHHAMIEEQRHTAGALKPHTAFITEIENLEMSELKSKSSHLAECIKRLEDELYSKKQTILAKNEIIKELLDCKEREEDAVLSLHNTQQELLLKEELLHINEKRVQQLTHLLNTTRSNLPHPLNMNYKLTWREAEEVPFGMTAPQHVVIGSTLYVGGGQTKNTSSNHRVLCYCTDSNKWDSLPPSPFMHFGLGQLAGKLITVGGSLEDNCTTVTGEVMQFSLESKSWVEIIDPMPTPRKRVCAVSYHSGIAACGGIEGDGAFSNVVEIYSQEQWSAASSLPLPRAALGALIKADRLYLMGGFYPSLRKWEDACQDCHSAELHVLFSASRTTQWVPLPPLPALCTTAVSHCGALLVMGGLRPHSFSNSYEIHAYSPGVNAWVHIGKLPFGRSSMMVTSTYNGEILLMGGWEEGFDSPRSTEVKIGSFTPAE